MKRTDGTKSTNIRIKRFKGDVGGMNKNGHGQSLPDLSNRDISNVEPTAKPKRDYLAEMRLNREAEENRQGGPHTAKKRAAERTIDQLMNDHKLSEYEKMDAVKRKAE